MNRLEGKSIVITGGTKGLGRGIAVAAAMEGASVTIAGMIRQQQVFSD